MNEEEKKAIDILKEYSEDELFGIAGREALQIVLNLIEKQQKEIEELNSEFAINTEIHKRDEEIKELKETIKCLHEPAENYISKAEVLKALGYEENDEEYKRIYNKEELILSLIRTINEECDRLEDIEDRKTMLEIHNIENQRDKYWQDKIRDKIKELEKKDIETIVTKEQFAGMEYKV